MASDSDLMLLLGRVEGKVDALVNLQSSTTQRVETIEHRQVSVEHRVTAIEAKAAGSKAWLAHLMSVAALVASIATVYFEYKR